MTSLQYVSLFLTRSHVHVAIVVPGLLRIKAHLRILESGVPSIGMSKNSRYPSSHSSSSSRSSPTASPRSYRDDDRHVGRRHSVSYAPSPPPYREMPWPPSAGSIEYFPERGGQRQQGARPEQFIRLQRQATSTYTPPNTTGYASSNISPRMMAVKPKRSSSVREESSSSRGRSRRYAEESEEDDWYDEKRPARGRSMKRN
ncbi:hypothetical protein B0T17DRAFT_531257 [Bombardia bombarda]|uniref:Uncharacterized protein n=1 Tax=Bombardia bombarda TaxID=252184 RepID=A0AA40C492_9PEZI|nr:hypothetical protein B0T17DRAFT_531257 [Bombardia bombarda]